MIFKFDIGDRVKHIDGIGHVGVVIEKRDTGEIIPRYQIEYTNVFTVSGIKMLYWLREDDIIMDKSYYRQQKLNQLL